MESEVAQINLKIVSYNLHGFMQGFSVLEDFINSEESPDVFLLQEHWLTPDNLSKFDYFSDYFSFGCSAMKNNVEKGMLQGRPFGGVMTLINKKFRKIVETIHCEDRYTAVRIGNYLIINVYLPCVGSPDRQFVCEELLASISVLRERYCDYKCIVAGDFNTDLDSSDAVAICINKFMSDYSASRCDNIFPSGKSVTYVNEALGHQSCIDYVLVTDVHEVLDFMVIAPDINFSDHLPLIVDVRCAASNLDDKLRVSSERTQLQLRWDRGDVASYYHYTGYFLMPILTTVDEMLYSLQNPNTIKLPFTELAAFIDRVYCEM